jgi:putative addiction module component (TIGR02574 family)
MVEWTLNHSSFDHSRSSGTAMSISADEIQRLSVAERLDLIQTIWESIADTPESLPLTDAQRAELDRRLERHARGESRTSSWSEVRARLEADE